MKYNILLAFVLFFTAVSFGCESSDPAPVVDVTFDEVTPSPRFHHTVHGCWFDQSTTVYRETNVTNLCELRSQGEDVNCKDLCVESALRVWNMCGAVHKCSALLWVDDENPLTSTDEEVNCWKCVEGCTTHSDRSPERYNLCRAEEERLDT